MCQLCSSIPFLSPEFRPIDPFGEILTCIHGQSVHFQLESANHVSEEYRNCAEQPEVRGSWPLGKRMLATLLAAMSS